MKQDEKNLILSKFQNDKIWIGKQILNTLSEILIKEEISNYEFLYIIIDKVNIINENFLLVNLSIFNFEKEDKVTNIQLVFYDKNSILTFEKEYPLKDIFQTIIDEILIDYNLNKKDENGYFFISNILPKVSDTNTIFEKSKNIFDCFFNQILPNQILSKMYHYKDLRKGKTNIYDVKLSNPRLIFGNYPNSKHSTIEIDTNITFKDIFYDDSFSIDFNFYVFKRFSWIYQNLNCDFLKDSFYQNILLDELDKVTNDKNKVFSNDDYSISFKKFDNLNKLQEFIKLKKGQKPEHMKRLLLLYNQGFLKSISELKYNNQTHVIECFFTRQPDIKVIFGENGIVTNENDCLYGPSKSENNTLLDAKKNLLILNELPLITNYIEKPMNYIDLSINDINLIVDCYNMKKSIENLELIAKMNNTLDEKLRQKGF